MRLICEVIPVGVGDRGRCRSCHAEIVWAITTGGRRIPIDPGSVGNGNIALELIDGVLIATFSSAAPASAPSLLYVSHFVSCPGAAQHRRPR